MRVKGNGGVKNFDLSGHEYSVRVCFEYATDLVPAQARLSLTAIGRATSTAKAPSAKPARKPYWPMTQPRVKLPRPMPMSASKAKIMTPKAEPRRVR